MTRKNRRKISVAIDKFMRRTLILLAIIVMLLSILLIFHKPIIDKIIAPHIFQKVNKQVSQMEPKEFIKNKKSFENGSYNHLEVNYGFKSVKPINLLDVKDVEFNKNYVTGQIAIPAVEMQLPIMESLTYNNLWFGACTMKYNERVGEGNFALAGHTMPNQYSLFSPLHRVSVGNTIYVTEGEYIYIYKVDKIFTVEPNQSDVIQDKKNETLITLVTCTDLRGTKRLIVQGEFLNKEKINKNNHNLL